MKSWSLRQIFNRHSRLIEVLASVVFVSLFVRTFVFTHFVVTQSNMSPIFEPGDFVFVYRLPFGVQIPVSSVKTSGVQPKLGEIILISLAPAAKQYTIARFLASPGDKVLFKDKTLVVNGLQVQEPWVNEIKWSSDLDLIVPQNKYLFVNQEGLTHIIGYEALVGKVKLLWLSKAKPIQWSRFPRLIN